jgi:predicted MFS family arabinose efflux permease
MSGKRLDVAVLLLGFLAFWANGDNYAAAPLLVRIASDLSLDIGTAALSVTSYMLFFGLLTVFFGPLGDRYGRARILKVAAFGSAVFSMLSAFVWDLPSLIIARAVNGGFSAGIMPLAVAYAGESSTPQTRQTRIGVVMGLMFLGGAMATAIGGAVASVGSWKIVYFIYGAAEFLTAIPLAFLLKGKATSPAAGILSSYKAVFANRKLLKAIGILFFVGFSTLGTFAFLGKFIQDAAQLNLILVGGILSAYGIGTLVGGMFSGGIRARIGARIFPAAGTMGFAGLLVLGITNALPSLAVPALFLYGLGFICLQSSIITTAQDLLPDRRGAVMSIASFTMVVSGALGTLINGKILAAGGYIVLIGLASLAFAAAGVLAAVLLRSRRARSYEPSRPPAAGP